VTKQQKKNAPARSGAHESVTPLSDARKARALSMLQRSAQGFYSLKTDGVIDGEEPSTQFAATRIFEKPLDDYFRFRIDYYPLFNAPSPGDFRKLVYFVDINDEIVESKFPLDRDIRSIITAFRLAFEKNRWSIIGFKRGLQMIALAFWLAAPAAFLAGQTQGMFAGVSAPLWMLAALALAGGFGAQAFVNWLQSVRDTQLKTEIISNGRTLATEIQARVNNLVKNFTEFLANIDREEAYEEMTDAEWTHRSAWWAKLTMWNPKRIEYIEKFVQSEMQRMRIFSIWSGRGGSAIAWLIWGGAIALAAAFTVAALAMTGGAGAVALESWLLLGAGAIMSIYATRSSLKTSITLADVTEAIGREPMGRTSRFADIELHNKVGEQIRRDKEKLRQAKLSGGYGSADSRKP